MLSHEFQPPSSRSQGDPPAPVARGQASSRRYAWTIMHRQDKSPLVPAAISSQSWTRWPACKLTGPGDTAPAGKAREEITNREQIGGPAERGLRMQCIAHAACAFILCENSGSTALQGTHHFVESAAGGLTGAMQPLYGLGEAAPSEASPYHHHSLTPQPPPHVMEAEGV